MPRLFADVCSAATHIYSSQAWVNKTHTVKLSRLPGVKRSQYKKEFFEYKLKKYYPLGRIVPGLTALGQTVLLWIWRAGMEGSETFHRQFIANYYFLLFTMKLHWYLSMHYKRLPPCPGRWWCQEKSQSLEETQGGRMASVAQGYTAGQQQRSTNFRSPTWTVLPPQVLALHQQEAFHP